MPVGGGGLTTSPGAVTHALQADFSGTAFGGSPTWTDITAYWMSSSTDPGGSPASEPWGRQDQSSTVESSSTSFLLNNADGRFTPGNASSPYYPNVKRRIRVRHTITDGTTTETVEDGYVDSWTVAVQTNGPTLSTVSLTDAFGRLQASTTLLSLIFEEMLVDAPTVLYPLDEAAGATSGGNLAGSGTATVKNSKYGAGAVTFGAALGFATDQTGVALSGGIASTTSHGSWLEVPTLLPASAAFSVELWFIGPSSASGTAMTLALQPARGTLGNQVGLVINGGGFLAAFVPALGGASELDGTTNVCDGKLHHVAMTLTSDLQTLTIYLDGAVEATYTNASTFAWTSTGPFQLGMFFQNNPRQIIWPFNGTFGPFAVYGSTLSATRVAAHHTAAVTAFAGESTATRWARLLTYRPNPGGTTSGTAGTVGAGDIAGQSLGDALTDVATAEGGVIQSNRGLITLIGRTAQRNPATTVTLDASLGQVDLPTTWRDDTQALVNDVTVSRPNGASQRAVNTTSTAADGVSQTSITANVNSDRDAADMAGWLVALGVVEHLDSPTLTANLYARADTSLTMAVCALKTYDVVALINLPASAPASTMSFQVQGGTYTVGADAFTAELYTTTLPPPTLRTDATADAHTLLDSGNLIGW